MSAIKNNAMEQIDIMYHSQLMSPEQIAKELNCDISFVLETLGLEEK